MHQLPRRPVLDRLLSKVDVPASWLTCWTWKGHVIPKGYGQIYVGGRMKRAHRVAYELAIGPIPEGMNLDHLCHTRDSSCSGGDSCLHRRCVNPLHLEPVSARDNTHRSTVAIAAQNAAKTHCPQGHEYTPENTYVWADAPGASRHCRTCARERARSRTRKAS
jgi:hypothetical protein